MRRFVLRFRSALALAGLIAVTVAVYRDAPSFDFVGIDDADYVTDNTRVLEGLTANNVAWAFTTTAESNWHPLTWLSLMVDGSLGATSRVFHTTNVALHIAAVCLLFLALARMTGAAGRSAFVAVVFAVHPLHVESVAWVSERKDVLSGLFWMAILLAYARYAKRPRVSRYLACWILLVLGLMAKPMLVTVPLVLVLLDYWPLGRLTDETGARLPVARLGRVLIVEKLPLLVPVAFSAAMTIHAQSSGGSMVALERVPWLARLANAFVSYARYLIKTIAPVDLAIPYPYRVDLLTVANVAGAVTLVGALSAGALFLGRRRPYVAVGWGWFLVTLVPVIGLVQVGSQSIADRYTYIPMTGLAIAFAWGATALARAWRIPAWAVAFTVLLLVAAMAVQARIQAGYWRDTKTLFTHALEATGENAVAHDALGLVCLDEGDVDGALRHFEEARRISPWNTRTRMNLAAALIRARRPDEAIGAYGEVLKADPDHAGALAGTGLANFVDGRMEEATVWMKRAIEAAPDDVLTHKRLAIALVAQGRDGEAIEHFETALRLDPGDEILRSKLDETRARLSRGRTYPHPRPRRTIR